MPAHQFQPEDKALSEAAQVAVSQADRLHADLDGCVPVGAEPHRLLEEVEARWPLPAPANDRWSLRRTAAFCLVTCGTFWGVSIYGLLQLIG